MSLSILKNLDSAERANKAADPKDVYALKKWLMTDLYKSYEEFKTHYYVKTKTPGVKIYELVTSEVCGRYQKCLKIVIDGEEVETGYLSFLQSFTHSMENKGRRATEGVKPPSALHARQGKGIPGVIQAEYAPDVTETMEVAQEAYKDLLITMYRLSHKKNWDIQKITKLMNCTYPLQRRDICQALQEIRREEDQQVDDPGKFIQKKLRVNRMQLN